MEKNYQLPDRAAERNRVGSAERRSYTMREDLRFLGQGKTYYIRTYGCQANVRDSETLAGMMERMGFLEVDKAEAADVVIFNTCAVRKAAEEHVLGEIGALKPLKQRHPEKIFALCGCMAQEADMVALIAERYRQIDLLFGTHNLWQFPQLLEKAMNGERTIEVVSEGTGAVVEGMPVQRTRTYKAFVNIMYGCDKFCTYCIVPYTRGKERSRQEEYILNEIREVKALGAREVTLLGQNVNAYGKDLGLQDGFTDLLRKAAETGIERIRFYSSHPRDYRETTIDVMKEYPNIMPALHLPVQSGSNEILKKMNRGYTIERYYELYDRMKEKIPGITFTTDLIVGFPSETTEQFEETLKLVDYCRFDSAFTFVYSPREGTPAARMEDDVSLKEKKKRLAILNERIGTYARENNEATVGTVLKVLCDGPSRKNANVLAGYSEENRLVNFTGTGIQEGDIVDVRITDAKSFSLDGEAVQ
ncbi:MAG: tRNA (N6-isopentenyl adenosine(37)-C2)-methylthiotransferase MiaB [Solobacterium sp.]|nr:tRNA (N6-isopentenyl adenosine(37)-C2)-methylthiotransferase MiaB [Solobacterium sp.]